MLSRNSVINLHGRSKRLSREYGIQADCEEWNSPGPSRFKEHMMLFPNNGVAFVEQFKIYTLESKGGHFLFGGSREFHGPYYMFCGTNPLGLS